MELKKLGLKIIMSGGVAQNIKANKIISEQKEVESLFVPPGPGDVISIGAAFCSVIENDGINSIQPIKNAYFGISYKNDETSETVKEFSSKFNYHLRELDLDFVVEKLDNGDVFGRFDINSMEFGARALGNRSIIVDPRNSQIIHTINKFVKMRDF